MGTKTDFRHILIAIYCTISSTGRNICHLPEHTDILFHTFCNRSDLVKKETNLGYYR